MTLKINSRSTFRGVGDFELVLVISKVPSALADVYLSLNFIENQSISYPLIQFQ